MYGVGQSERRYGQALHGRARDSYVLSTKVGRVLHPSEPDSAQMTWSFDFSRQGVRKSFADVAGTARRGLRGHPVHS